MDVARENTVTATHLGRLEANVLDAAQRPKEMEMPTRVLVVCDLPDEAVGIVLQSLDELPSAQHDLCAAIPMMRSAHAITSEFRKGKCSTLLLGRVRNRFECEAKANARAAASAAAAAAVVAVALSRCNASGLGPTGPIRRQ